MTVFPPYLPDPSSPTLPTIPSMPAAAALPVARPTLIPGLRRLWRGGNTLQLGTDPARAVVLDLPNPAAAGLLDLLDGTRSERAVIAQATRCGATPAEAAGLLDTLRRTGLVVGAQTLLPPGLPDRVRRRLTAEAAALALRGTDAPGSPAQILRRRAAARVAVTGRGRLAAPVALGLATSGVGHVSPALDGEVGPGDPLLRPGQALAAAVADLIAATAPGTTTAPVRRRQVSFAVEVGPGAPASLRAARYARDRLAHLSLTVRDGTVVIGPLVAPAGSPCLQCLDLHRLDRDPAWRDLAAQLATGPVPATEPCAATTVLAAGAFAAAEVLAWLDGAVPSTVGASVEVAAPGQFRRRSWPPHPHCDCVRRTRNRRVTPPRRAGGDRADTESQ